jgi:hypothetical protein
VHRQQCCCWVLQLLLPSGQGLLRCRWRGPPLLLCCCQALQKLLLAATSGLQD